MELREESVGELELLGKLPRLLRFPDFLHKEQAELGYQISDSRFHASVPDPRLWGTVHGEDSGSLQRIPEV